jgi:hypothetical protein
LRYDHGSLVLIIVSLWSAILLEPPARADQSPEPYLAELIQRATELRLSEERYWHVLLHYQPNLSGGYTSQAGDPGFFLSPHGKTDPQAELTATLAQFFSDELVGRSRQPAQCAFVGRYQWLKAALAFDDRRLPPQRCDRLAAWLEALDARSITLIFPSAYLNNPASMFGHTLLRIDQKNQTELTRILAYTVNFAAEVTTRNAVAYAVLGLTGGFKGYFSTLPYYMKVQEYRDIENRDIWEYRLNLTSQQLARLLWHAWELGNTHFDYYFLKENCSYYILSLLEAAVPELHLTDRFLLWTVPADTVRAIAEQPGLMGEIVYRPARTIQIRQQYAAMSNAEQGWLHRIVREPAAARSDQFLRLSRERQAFVLDVASEYLRYRSVADEANAPRYKESNRTVLSIRSGLKIPSKEFKIVPFTSPPEEGHKIHRLGVSSGWRQDDFFEEVNVRLAYHDLLDPERGYTPDAQIELMSVAVRHYQRRDQTRLERVTLANIISLSPMDGLFQKPSWKISGGLQTVRGNRCRLCSNLNVNGGMGAAVESRWIGREVYFALAELDANYSQAYAEDHRAGGGGTAGLLADVTERWKVLLSASYLRFPLGDRSDTFRASFHQRYTVQKDLAVRVELTHRDPQDNEALVVLHGYF